MVREDEIIRYRPNPAQILSSEEYLHFEATIDHFVAYNSGCLVVTGEASQNTHYFLITHKDFKPVEFTLPFSLENPSKNFVLTHAEHAFILNDGTVYEANF